MDKIKSYFSRYPKSDECFENGGLLFHNRGAADSYGKTETKRHTRSQLKDDESHAKTKQSIIEKISDMEDFTSIPYEELKIWQKVLGLEVADSKKETLITALTEFKETLNAN